MTTSDRGSLSIVVPLGSGERLWRPLVEQICQWSAAEELILVIPVGEPDPELQPDGRVKIRVLRSVRGRARQINAGIRGANGDIVFVVHADSRFDGDPSAVLCRNAMDNVLAYAQLAFDAESPGLTRLNSIGARFRSRVLGIPFGDQGMLALRTTWTRLGDFDESAAYGEDHLMVWRARSLGIRLVELPIRITTSGRKYRERGWLQTTAKHLVLTLRQAVPGAWSVLCRP